MENDDDILVLQHSHENNDEEVDCEHSPAVFIPTSPLWPKRSIDCDEGSLHALQKAYADVKRRLQESGSRNEALAKRVKELESAKCGESLVGDSYDMMEDMNYVTSTTVEAAQMGAEEGYAANLQRQLRHTKVQLQTLEKNYQRNQEMLGEKDSRLAALTQQLQEQQEQLGRANQEKMTVQQACEALKLEKEAALQSLRDANLKCQNLEIEKDKVMKEGASLHLALQKANQEVAILKEKQADSLSESPPELVAELAHMRKVIDSLKHMVLVQRKFLDNRPMSLSMQQPGSKSLLQGPASAVDTDHSPPASNRSGGSHSGQSWEMVNGGAASLNARQQQMQQQKQQLMTIQQRTVSSTSGYVRLQPDPSAKMTAPKPAVNGSGESGQFPKPGNQVAGQRSKTEYIQRKRGEEEASHPRCKTEVLRANPASGAAQPGLANWMGRHYQQGPRDPQVPPPQANQPRFQERGGSNAGSPVTLPQSQRTPYPPAPFPGNYPVGELSSTYDNITLGSTGPSMHIVNRTALGGARVVRSSSDGFGSSGGSTMTLTPEEPGLGVAGINRDGALPRPFPQEHADLTGLEQNATHLHLTDIQPIRFENEPPVHSSGVAEDDKKCPVCNQDFNHVPMDEFQTHVFECFDDAEDTHAPETLQPMNTPTQGKAAPSADKVCPMCDKTFPQDISQQYFEGHVQSHFAEIDAFEVLDRNQN